MVWRSDRTDGAYEFVAGRDDEEWSWEGELKWRAFGFDFRGSGGSDSIEASDCRWPV